MSADGGWLGGRPVELKLKVWAWKENIYIKMIFQIYVRYCRHSSGDLIIWEYKILKRPLGPTADSRNLKHHTTHTTGKFCLSNLECLIWLW